MFATTRCYKTHSIGLILNFPLTIMTTLLMNLLIRRDFSSLYNVYVEPLKKSVDEVTRSLYRLRENRC